MANEDDSTNCTSEIRDLSEIVERLHGVELVKVTRGTDKEAFAVSIPQGRKLESIKELLDEYLVKPERRSGTAHAYSRDSFIALIRRMATPTSAVFANPAVSGPNLLAVLDYFPVSGDPTQTDWLGHRISYLPPLSDEWKKWWDKNGKFMSQSEFAQFIEERIQNIIVPNFDDPNLKTYADLVQGTFAEPSQLVALSRNLEVSVGVAVKSAVRLSTGEITIQYTEQHSDGSGSLLKVPNLFQVCIPVFFAGTFFRMAAHLRYKVSGGSVTWAYSLVQPEVVLKNAFDGLADEVQKGTDLPLYFGTPEAGQ